MDALYRPKAAVQKCNLEVAIDLMERLLELPLSAYGKLWFADLTRAGFGGIFILGSFNSSSLAKLCYKRTPR